MKNALKIAIVAGIAVAALAACTSGPAPVQNATSAIQLPAATIEPPVSVTTTVVTSTVTNPARPDSFGQQEQADTRIGYGKLKLRMSPEEATAAGLTGLNWGPNGDATCSGAQNVAISKKYGIERITLPADAKTSKGIGIGSTIADVKRAYPDAKEFRAGLSAKVDDTGSYVFTTYGFADTEEIVQIKLVSNLVDCAFAVL